MSFLTQCALTFSWGCTGFDYFRSAWSWTWPDLGTQIQPNPELDPDLGRTCFGISEQYTWWN